MTPSVTVSRHLQAAIAFAPVLLSALICPYTLYAQDQDIRFEQISIEEGLPQSSVRCILQDSRGFMWFGTEDGLNRYDGYSFITYSTDPGDPHSISNNFIRAIYEDSTGAIWVGTNGGGLNKFDRLGERFTRFQNDPDDQSSLSSNIVWSILEDSAGTLWVGTAGGGLNSFDRQTERFTHYQADPGNPESLSNDFVRAILEDSTGALWIGTQGGGLNILDRETGRFSHYIADPENPKSLSNNIIYSIHEDRSGMIWIGTLGGGLNRFDRATSTFTHFPASPDNPDNLGSTVIWAIHEDSQRLLWIGTEGGGLYRLDPETESFTRFTNDPNNSESLSNDFVRSILEDKSGVLWVGTDTGGVNKMVRRKSRFAVYRRNPNNPNSLSDNHIWSITEDQSGKLCVGTRNAGFDIIDRENKKFTNYRHDPADPESLGHNFVRKIYKDRADVIWIGTHNGGLNRFDPAAGKFRRYQHNPDDPDSLSDNAVYTILEDRAGVLWVGTRYGGLNRFDRDSERFTHYRHDPENPDSLRNDFVYVVFEDYLGILWVGTFGGGLNKLNRETGMFTSYRADINNPDSPSNDFVLSIYEDSSRVLWIGTGGGGLNEFERATGTFKRYLYENSGLASNIVYGILEDEEGNLWLSTNQGLSKFDPRTEAFKNYDVNDGLQSNEFNGGAYHKGKKGELFFGGINGFNAFHPASITDNPYIPPIVITNLRLFDRVVPIGETADGRTILDKSISEIEEIVLSHGENYLSFEFAALDYTIPSKNQYMHKLVGFDKYFVFTGPQKRFSSYKNLPPGEYVFRAWGSNNDGVWNQQGVSLKVIITPPFWETWWFRLAAVIAVVALVSIAYRIRVRRIREQHRLEERIQREMEIAHEIQRSLLPAAPPKLDGATIAVTNVPAKHVGGDFYTFIKYGPRRIGVVIGDIVGNGVPGALNMAATVSSLRVIIPRSTTVAETMNWLNSHLVENTARRSFAAVLYAVLDFDEMSMHWCNAGLPEPVVIPRKGPPRFLEMPSYSLPPGASPRSQYHHGITELTAGDVLVFLTDGIIEVRPSETSDEEFGYTRLLNFLSEYRGRTPELIIDSLIRELERFQGKTSLEDDFTVVAVRID